ncbi:MAG: hypothetical protein ACO3GN_09470 [Bacteroidia bacterium]|jgi:hypothetical protein
MIRERFEIIGINNKDLTIVDLEIGMPRAILKNNFEVELKLNGLFDELPTIKGDTAFEALLNTLLFVSNLMSGYQKKGCLIQSTHNREQLKVNFPKVELVWT